MKEITASTSGGTYKIQIGYEALMHSSRLEEIIADGDIKALMLSSYLYNLHYEYLGDVLAKHTNRSLFLVQDSEENKNYEYAGKFLQSFAEAGITRKSCVWSIGGGVMGDFAGFCAALYMRGIPLVQCPTTLLAMVDASIGGKVAVNIGKGKNLAGAFHQPVLVVADTFFLQTLGETELKCGLAEIIKHGLLGDGNTMDILLANTLSTIKRPELLSELIYHSAVFKAGVVSRDEREEGLRAILNLGHTVAHGIESAAQYKGVSHGEAVAMGLLAESRMSAEMGLLSKEELRLVEEVLARYELPGTGAKLEVAEIIKHMKFDKKNKAKTVMFSLLKSIGKPVYNQTVPENIMISALEEVFRG